MTCGIALCFDSFSARTSSFGRRLKARMSGMSRTGGPLFASTAATFSLVPRPRRRSFFSLGGFGSFAFLGSFGGFSALGSFGPRFQRSETLISFFISMPIGLLEGHSKADGDSERRVGHAALDLLADRDSDERIPDADIHADKALKGGCEAGKTRGAACEDDLTDAERVGLALVELKRGHELAGEALERTVERLAGEGGLLGGESLRDIGAVERDVRLEDLGGFDVQIERSRKGDRQRHPAPLDNASELAGLAVRDPERAALGSHRDSDQRALLARRLLRWHERAEQRERLEVDAGELDTCAAAGRRVRVHELAIRDDEKNTLLGLAFLDGLAKHLVVEQRLVDRNRQRLLGAETHGVRDLLRVLDPHQLDRPDTDPVVRDADPNVALRQAVPLEEELERLGERGDVLDLAAGDDPARNRLTGDLDEPRRAVHLDGGRREERGPDLEADSFLGHDCLAPRHPQASRRSVGGCESVALKEAEQLVGPARAGHGDLLRDDPARDEVDERLLEGLHAAAGIGLHDRVDLLDLRLADEVPDSVVGEQDLEGGHAPLAVHSRKERLRDDSLDRGCQLDADLLLLRGREN